MTAQFGHYRLERPLGSGGMGQVWAALDTRDGRRLALKLLPAELAADEGYRTRFEREALLAAALRDPHIPAIHGHGAVDGRLFIDMELVEGADLSARLAAHGPLDPHTAVDILTQVAAALDAAHAAGLIHRDVKPSNILVRPDGFAYLIDFGIARTLGQTSVTATGLTIGTWAYMAPERFNGHADARSDIYSLACVLFEALTGRRPYGDTEPAQQMHGHLMTDPPRAAVANPAVPPALDEILARGMAKEPALRPAGAGEFVRAARTALGDRAAHDRSSTGSATAPPPTRIETAASAVGRTPTPTKALPAPASAGAAGAPPASARIPGPTDTAPAPGRPDRGVHPGASRYAEPVDAADAAGIPDPGLRPPGRMPDPEAAEVGADRVPVRTPHPTKVMPVVEPTGGAVAPAPVLPPGPPAGGQRWVPPPDSRRVDPVPAPSSVDQRTAAPRRMDRRERPISRTTPRSRQPAPRRRRRRGGVLRTLLWTTTLILVAPCVFAVGCLAVLASSSSDGSSEQKTPPPAATVEEPAPGRAGVAPAGTSVRDGKFEFAVAGLDSGERVGFQNANGSFLIVTLAVLNHSDETKWFLPFGQKLILDDGAIVEHDATATAWQAVQHRLGHSFELPPGASGTAVLVFDVPDTASAAHLELHDFVLSEGVSVALY
ncbi:protein kinase domain-containing protein [Nocardia shimofusensis]|uniref:protein kinase domain-containing protein n=1 Tax=Nocardia shimofusensis TaxID=228596 RepID=UPI00082E4E84|nr:protein kinase [Nocardia shimofusensis]